MTLDQYLASSGRTGADFAAAVGLTEASVSRIRKGQQNMRRDVMRRIIAASGGCVTADGLVQGEDSDVHGIDVTCDAATASLGNEENLSTQVPA